MSAAHESISRRTLFIVFGALMVLLAATTALSFVKMAGYEAIPAYLIAVVKAALVIGFFMEVKLASRLTWVFIGAAFLWLAILMSLSIGDYLTRGWTPGGQETAAYRMPIIAAPLPSN